MRGKVKDVARSQLERFFAFEHRESAMAANRQLYLDLIGSDAYTHLVSRSQKSIRSSLS